MARKAAEMGIKDWSIEQVAEYIAQAFPQLAPIIYGARFFHQLREARRSKSKQRLLNSLMSVLDYAG
jgi:hypothetical protein